MKNRDQVASLTVNLGLFSNILLSIVKTAVGIIGHSPALLADGVNSTSDMVYYIAVKIFISIRRYKLCVRVYNSCGSS